MPKNAKQQTSPMRFESMLQTDVPKGRDGKHKAIMEQLLGDLNHLENIRSALSRATRQKGIDIATSSDEEFLYVWRTESTASGNGNKHRGTAR
jgi:glycogen synthase